MTSDPHPNPAPRRRIWVLVKAARTLECEIKEHVKGHEVRVYLGGELYYRRFDVAWAEAEAQAAALKRMLLADGWTHR